MTVKRKRKMASSQSKKTPNPQNEIDAKIAAARAEGIVEVTTKIQINNDRSILGAFANSIEECPLPPTSCLSGIMKVGNDLRGLTLPVDHLKKIAFALRRILKLTEHDEAF